MTRTSVIVSPAPSSGSMLGEQDQEMMGDRVPGDQMIDSINKAKLTSGFIQGTMMSLPVGFT